MPRNRRPAPKPRVREPVREPDPSSSESEEEPLPPTTAPWPREDGKPFEAPGIPIRPCMKEHEFKTRTGFNSRTVGESWQKHNSIVYNGTLYATLLPTKVLCHDILTKMGIESDVLNMLDKMGLGTFFTKSHYLYPEPVRQFISSCEVVYDHPLFPRASEGKLTYLYRGELHTITIPDLCRLYGFNPNHERVTFPTIETRALWSHIAAGVGPGKAAKFTLIRNPAVRVVSKIIAHLFFGQYEAGAMRHDAMLLINTGLPDFVQSLYGYEKVKPPAALEVNLGAIFAQVLFERRFRFVDVTNPTFEQLGSLLTPIFEASAIDLSSLVCEKKVARFDEKFMQNTKLLKGKLLYSYNIALKHTTDIQLPCPELTALTSLENLGFQHGLPDADIPESSAAQTGSTSDPIEYLLPEYAGQYDPAPLADDASEREMLRWVVEDNRKRFSMTKKIWEALAKIPVPRCLRDPDVAGHRTDATTSRRSRKRSAQTRSESPPELH